MAEAEFIVYVVDDDDSVRGSLKLLIARDWPTARISTSRRSSGSTLPWGDSKHTQDRQSKPGCRSVPGLSKENPN
jgi:hypothetical protein